MKHAGKRFCWFRLRRHRWGPWRTTAPGRITEYIWCDECGCIKLGGIRVREGA